MQRCGYAAIVGRPNVGKSTLLNQLIGQKLAITSRKPQTTRTTLLGIVTAGPVQTVWIDTPGLHASTPRAINRQMNRVARGAMSDVDVAVMVVDRGIWTAEDAAVLAQLQQQQAPLVCAVNKVDRLPRHDAVLPVLAGIAARNAFCEVVPVSALRGHNVDRLAEVVGARLPEGLHQFDADEVTDRSVRFLAAEAIREQLIRQLGGELPYRTAVAIERFDESASIVEIHAAVLVERDGQKAIVIGRGGERMKAIGSRARASIEALLGRQVMLHLWAKVRTGWSDSDAVARHTDPDRAP